jgi:LacI family transcriptional regulator
MSDDRSMTLNDIAKLAGVSRSTVSRVVNDDPRVRESVRRRVQETIAQVGYQPNAAARALASRRSGVIGLVVPPSFAEVYADPWFPPLVQSCLDAARDTGFSVMVLMDSVEDEAAVSTLISRFIRPRTVEGLVITNSLQSDALTPRLQAMGFPYVLIGRAVESDRNFVDVTNRQGTRHAMHHLLEHGCRRPAMINGEEFIVSALDRRLGFEDALGEAGVDLDATPRTNVDFWRPGAYDAALQLLQGDDPPDCILAASDTIAISVIDAATSVGRRVPEDLAVIGFDDINAARNERLGLTSVRQPVDALGRAAVGALMDLINGRAQPPVQRWLDTTLSIRHTCGCDPSIAPPGDTDGRKEGAVAPG